jgi:hypothetical protein
MMNSIRENIEPALSFARECIIQVGSGSGDPGEAVSEAITAVDACSAYLDLMREPIYEYYAPDKLLEERSAAFTDDRHLLEAESLAECVGDPEQVFLCVRELVRSAELYEDSALVAELFEKDDVPRVVLNLDGPGDLPSRLLVGGHVPLSLKALGVRWTAATRGGRMDKTANGLTLSLKGMREVCDKGVDDGALVAAVCEAEKRLRLVTAAQDAKQGVEGALSNAQAALDALLELVDGESTEKEPGDLASVLNEVIAECRSELEAHSIAVEPLCDGGIPPLAMVRRRVALFFASAMGHARRILPRGGGVSLLVDYDQGAREACIVIVINGTQCALSESIYTASMRRATMVTHGGAFDLSPEENGVTITATLPDPVGATLDAWIPGWEVFSERSCQMLRLLKSGGQVPPEDFLLGGILEEELGRWLMPRLAEAPAINLAHDLKPEPGPFPKSSSERLLKALGQIQRGKARKELAKPPYAAEILWAYRSDERHRKAVGAERLDEDAVRALSQGLLESPMDCVGCLCLVSRALGGSV